MEKVKIHQSRILLLLFIIISPKLSFAQDDFFRGFKQMEIPRNTIPMGAIWSDAGPLGYGVLESELEVSESFSNLNSDANKSFKEGLNLSVLSFLKIGGGYVSSSNLNIDLKSIKIVRVASTDVLRKNIGNSILYEAIKAEDIIFTIEKSKSAELKADLAQKFKDITIVSETEYGTTKRIETKGVGLYIAYRVVNLQKQNTSTKKVKFKSQGSSSSSGIKFSNTFYFNYDNYIVTLCPCNILSCAMQKVKSNLNNENIIAENQNIWLNQCLNSENWTITIVDKKDISEGQPKETKIFAKMPFDIWNKIIPLSNKVRSDGIEINYLNIEHLFLDVKLLKLNGYGYVTFKGNNEKTTIVKEKIKVTTVRPNGGNGW
ncbi:MAG: hypothetical protein Q8J88_11790 [Bacteroidales bacterium]|nr:hypothetical protein [Bacteroidales bacterium]